MYGYCNELLASAKYNETVVKNKQMVKQTMLTVNVEAEYSWSEYSAFCAPEDSTLICHANICVLQHGFQLLHFFIGDGIIV
jgi:hypothetical protein